MNNEKIIILGAKNINKFDLAKLLIDKDEELDLAPIFSTNDIYKDKYSIEIKYLSPEDITIGYKNNAFLYVSSDKDYISSGITLDDVDNSDILCMNISDFNNISNIIFSKYNFLIIWLDTKYRDKNYNIKEDIVETKYLIEKLDYFNYMYFLDEDYEDISDIIIKYLKSSEEEKEKILNENL